MPEFSPDEISLALFLSLPALLLFFRRFGPGQVKDGSSLAHNIRLMAEDLRSAGSVFFGDIQKSLGLLIVIDEGFCAYHFRYGIGCSQPETYMAEGKVAHTCHGSQCSPSGKLQVPYLHHDISSPTGQWSEPWISGRM